MPSPSVFVPVRLFSRWQSAGGIAAKGVSQSQNDESSSRPLLTQYRCRLTVQASSWDCGVIAPAHPELNIAFIGDGAYANPGNSLCVLGTIFSRCGMTKTKPGCRRLEIAANRLDRISTTWDTGFVPLLYRYCDPDGIAALRTMSLPASNPSFFNDPFEVRPCFDQERHDYFAKSHESFYAQLGVPHSLVAKGSMVGIPTENAVDFRERLQLSAALGRTI